MGPYVALQAPSWQHASGAIMRRTPLEPKKCKGIASPQKAWETAMGSQQSTNDFWVNSALRRPYGPPPRKLAVKQTAAHSALWHQPPYKGHRKMGSQCQSRSGTSHDLGGTSTVLGRLQQGGLQKAALAGRRPKGPPEHPRRR